MPIKNYYTVNGRIRDESTVAGGHRTYGLDALGSVVATYDGTGALENTYRTAPYGTQVQKTGIATDPSFKWNGGSGYRTTSRSYSPYYVRARHLDYLTARWTTVDPLWPGERAYTYAANPTISRDPSGKSCTPVPSGFALETSVSWAGAPVNGVPCMNGICVFHKAAMIFVEDLSVKIYLCPSSCMLDSALVAVGALAAGLLKETEAATFLALVGIGMQVCQRGGSCCFSIDCIIAPTGMPASDSICYMAGCCPGW